jgi:tetratricopeptide (TPR) repeat protein
MLSKTTACSLPAVLLVLAWYVDGKTWIRRIPAMIPFFIIGVCLAAVTVYTERVVVGTAIDSVGLRLPERFIVAGHALWFYTAKAVVPWPTMFVYPRWQLDVHSPMQDLWPVTAAAVLVTAWALRGKIGRGVAAALFIFAGTLVPALGFVDVYPFKFSFVADHFQYLALPAMLCLLCAGLMALFKRASMSMQASRITLSALAVVFGVLAARQARSYMSAETLYRDAIAKNPDASMPHNNLGQILARNGDLAGAEKQYRAAIAAEPDFGGAYFNLGDVLMRQGNAAKGGEAIEKAIALDPQNARLYFHAGLAYARQKNAEKAIGYFEQAAKLKPDYVDPLLELGNVYAQTGHPEMAVPRYQQALALNDDNPIAHANLANAHATLGHLPEALAQFERALELDPADRQSWSNYAMALDQAGRHDDARRASGRANQLTSVRN